MSAERRGSAWVLATALVTTGLLAGLFYAYACSVMPGLSDAEDRSFVDAMQQINKAIENPVFFATFLGSPVLALWALIRERRSGARETARWIAIALILNLIGLVITFAFNIPLNDDLEKAGDPARIADVPQVLDDFEGPWVAWNIVRGVALTASLCALARALYLCGRMSIR
jgi:uncharacterized membrane protein